MEYSEKPDYRTSTRVFECNERGRIIRSDYRDETLQRVCRAAPKHGGFIGAAVLLADLDQSLIFTAGAGDGIEVMKGVKISTVENTSKSRRKGAGQFVRRTIEKRFS